mmetsp:Transcript_15220/g.24720  ORF Transcript_15220/g.24720 Transcript_15220/m.24720 type:complete len:307 (+) Transcript_15220:416-1336(+)
MTWQWDNCTWLIEQNAFPSSSVNCSKADNFALWFVSSFTIVYTLLFLGLLALQAIKTWPRINWRARVILVLLAACVICIFIQALSNLLWLGGALTTHPWDTRLGYANILDVIFFLSVISLKSSSLARILRQAKKMKKNGAGVLEWGSLVVAIIDPIAFAVILILFSLKDLWKIFVLQEAVWVGFNFLLICGLVYIMVGSGISFSVYKHAGLEIFGLQFFAMVEVTLELVGYYHTTGIPISVWMTIEALKTVPAFIALIFLLHFVKKPDRSSTAFQTSKESKVPRSIKSSTSAPGTTTKATTGLSLV